jgi:prepilin-type N-terminal cleavage/methylation domain-containing protein
MKKRFSSGLTLIELLVAISIFSAVSLVIYSVFSVGIFAWKREKGFSRLFQETSSALHRIDTDFSSIIPPAMIRFVGKADEIYFPAIIADNSNADEINYIPVKILFRTKLPGKSQKGFFRNVIPFEKAFKETRIRKAQSIGAMKDVSFEYLYLDDQSEKNVWKPIWQDTQLIPKFVRINFSFNNKEQSDKLIINRMFCIPMGEVGTWIEEESDENQF